MARKEIRIILPENILTDAATQTSQKDYAICHTATQMTTSSDTVRPIASISPTLLSAFDSKLTEPSRGTSVRDMTPALHERSIPLWQDLSCLVPALTSAGRLHQTVWR